MSRESNLARLIDALIPDDYPACPTCDGAVTMPSHLAPQGLVVCAAGHLSTDTSAMRHGAELRHRGPR